MLFAKDFKRLTPNETERHKIVENSKIRLILAIADCSHFKLHSCTAQGQAGYEWVSYHLITVMMMIILSNKPV